MPNGTTERDAAVLELLRARNATRPQIAEATGMSKPTVSAAIATLEGAGLVRQDGQIVGATGRSPAVYALNAGARLVAGIDVGGVNTRVALGDLRGEILAEHTEPTESERVVDQVADMVARLRTRIGRRLGHRPALSAAVLSTPGVVSEGSLVRLAYNVHPRGTLDYSALPARIKAPLRVENNVNLAAIGEHRLGAARGVSTFLQVSIGAGIGVGTVYGGSLLRGHHGAAGEISYLPIGARPLGAQDDTGNYESATAAAGLLERARARPWPIRPPRDVAELFAWAADPAGDPTDGRAAGRADGRAALDLAADPPRGAARDPALDPAAHRAARRLVADEGQRVGLAVVAARTIIDPEIVVLGGGIGRNALLIEPVQDVCDRLLPVPCPIVTTELADRGSLLGAIMSAADDAWRAVVKPDSDEA